MVEALAEKIRQGAPELPPELHEMLVDRSGLFVTYVEGFVKSARVCLWSRAMGEKVEGAEAALSDAVDELDEYQERIKGLSDAAEYPHQVIQLIDYKRIADIVREGREEIGRASCRERVCQYG